MQLSRCTPTLDILLERSRRSWNKDPPLILASRPESLRFSFISHMSRFSTTALYINQDHNRQSVTAFDFDYEIVNSRIYKHAMADEGRCASIAAFRVSVADSLHVPEEHGVTFPLANPALPYLQAGHVPVASNICYTCNVSYKNATTLAKHQTEFCERKVEWVCLACPRRVFGLQERLNRHHMDAHADSCPYGCDKREKLHSEACKLQLSKYSRHLAIKKAWGCPCCVKCFESLEEWSYHVSSHPIQNEKVQNWSFSTMIWSLLKQPYISHHVTPKCWECCIWSTLSKELTLSLRHALERHEVPAAVSAHVDYCGLDGPAVLVKYAFNLGTTGEAHPRKRKTDSSRYQSAADLVAHSPAGWPLPAERATLLSNAVDRNEAHPSFRERQSQSGQKLTQVTNPHCSEVEGSRHLSPFPSSGIRIWPHEWI